MTACKLASDIYLKNYIGDHTILFISNLHVYNHIKNAYFGGISEVYIPNSKDLFYYDVNYLYPFPAYNPMPSLSCTYFEYNDRTIDLTHNHFGLYYCKIEVSDRYIGLLPYRSDTHVLYPNSTWES